MSTKKPEHPGKILKMLMEDEDHIFNMFHPEIFLNLCFERTRIPPPDLTILFEGKMDIDYILAFRLGKFIKGTDMAFWLKIQKDYDDYVELGEDDEGTPERANRDEEWIKNYKNSINKDLILACVHSTKHWLYHYILDIIEHDDKNYKDIKRVIEEICTFQDDILKEISK